MNDKVVVSGDANLRNIIDGQPNVIYEKSINEHDKLTHRDYADQHPIEAITGLTEELERIEGEIPVVPEVPTKLSDLQNDVGFITTESDPSVPEWAKQPTKPTYTAVEVGALPDDTEIPVVPTDVSAFNNDAGYLTSYTETDPTVPAWAKASSKPTYTAQEVGALPDDTVIPTVPSEVSAFTNDAGYLTQHQDISGKQDVIPDLSAIRAGAALGATAVQTETDPTVPSWAKASTKPSYTASEVGALPSTTAIPSKTSDLVNDSGFITAADVPEGSAASTTTPKMDGTAAVGTETAFARGDHRHPTDTSRVPTSRTVNGKALSSDITLSASDVSALPDSTVIPTVPTNVSAFTNDAGYLTSYTETDPTVPSWAKQSTKPTYTASEVGALPSTYTPPVTSVNGQTGAVVLSIPTVPTAISSFQNDAGYLTLATLPIYDGTVI